MRIRFLAAAGVLLLVSNAAAGQGGRKSDPLDLLAPAIIGAQIGDSLASAVAAAERFVAAAHEGSAEVQRLRDEFWREYPKGSRFAEVDAAFGRALFAKDLYYLPLYIVGGERDPVAKGLMAIGPVDGGIHPFAKPAYLAWVEEIREKIAEPGTSGRVTTLSAMLTKLPVAALANTARYQDYRMARDWAEAALVGRTPAVDGPTYVKMLFRHYGHVSEAAGATVSQSMLDAVGPERLDKAVKAVRAAAKDKNGYLTDEGLAPLQLVSKMVSPDAINCSKLQRAMRTQNPRSANACDESVLNSVQQVVPPGWGVVTVSPLAVLEALVAREHLPTYVRRVILNVNRLDDRGGLRTETPYQRYVAAYGEREVLEVGAAIQRAPVRRWGGLVDTTPLGYPATDVAPELAFAGILAMRNPKGAARVLIAFGQSWDIHVTSKLVDQEYAKLAALRGEQSLVDAAAQVHTEVSAASNYHAIHFGKVRKGSELLTELLEGAAPIATPEERKKQAQAEAAIRQPRVGQTIAEVEAEFGAPTQKSSSSAYGEQSSYYYYPDFLVTFRNGIVTEVRRKVKVQ